MQNKRLKQQLLFNTKSGNSYLQDTNQDLLLFIPPRLKRIFMEDGKCEKDANNPFGNDTDKLYYEKKHEFLRKHFHSQKSDSRRLVTNVPKSTIENSLINTRQLLFEVTDSCNLKCKYCGYGDLYFGHDKRNTKMLSWEYAKNLIDYFFSLWDNGNYISINRPISFGFYGGEPLLNFPLISKIIEYSEKNAPKGIQFTYHMTTNGTMLYKYIGFLVEKKFRISVSLDGNEENNSYRIKQNEENSFETIYNNIKMVQTDYPNFFNEYVNFIAVLHSQNSIQEINDFFLKEFDKSPTILEVGTVGIKEEKINEFKSIFKSKRKSIMESKNVEKMRGELLIKDPDVYSLMNYVHQYTGNVFKDYKDLFINKDLRRYYPTGTCIPLSRRVFLTVNGKILPCERIDQKYTLGKVTNDSVYINAQKIADDQSKHYKELFNMCARCYYQKMCLECMYSNYKLISERECDNFMDEDKFKTWLSDTVSFIETYPEFYERIMKEVIVE